MYGLPEDYRDPCINASWRHNDDLLRRLVEMQFDSNTMISAVELSVSSWGRAGEIFLPGNDATAFVSSSSRD